MKDNEMAFLSLVALGAFSVDSEGRIWRHQRLAGSRTGGPSIPKSIDPPVRAEKSISHDHPKVMFYLNGRRYQVYAHRVVWMIANHAEIPEQMEINHKDGKPRNAHPDNLEVVYRSENVRHAVEVLKKLPRWGNKQIVKLTDEQALEIFQLAKDRVLTQAQIAARYGVSVRMVQAIYYGQKWKHLPRD